MNYNIYTVRTATSFSGDIVKSASQLPEKLYAISADKAAVAFVSMRETSRKKHFVGQGFEPLKVIVTDANCKQVFTVTGSFVAHSSGSFMLVYDATPGEESEETPGLEPWLPGEDND